MTFQILTNSITDDSSSKTSLIFTLSISENCTTNVALTTYFHYFLYFLWNRNDCMLSNEELMNHNMPNTVLLICVNIKFCVSSQGNIQWLFHARTHFRWEAALEYVQHCVYLGLNILLGINHLKRRFSIRGRHCFGRPLVCLLDWWSATDCCE